MFNVFLIIIISYLFTITETPPQRSLFMVFPVHDLFSGESNTLLGKHLINIPYSSAYRVNFMDLSGSCYVDLLSVRIKSCNKGEKMDPIGL